MKDIDVAFGARHGTGMFTCLTGVVQGLSSKEDLCHIIPGPLFGCIIHKVHRHLQTSTSKKQKGAA